MDAAHRLDALRTEGEAAGRAADGRLDAAVPHLDWSAGGVIGHLGGVHQRFARSLRKEVDRWPERDDVSEPDGDLVEWYRTMLARLVTALGSVELDDTFATWAGEQDGHWVLRRVANETTVHRWDIQAASGPPDPIAAPLAIDITEEFLTEIVPDRGLPGVDDLAAHDGATLHLHATDTDQGEWFLTVRGDGVEVEHRHEKGDVALRGTAGDLALWLYGRLPPSRLDAFGDPEAVTWWSRAFRFD